MPHILFKQNVGTVDMQMVNTIKSFNCNGFCDRSFKPPTQRVFVTYNFPDEGGKVEKILCVDCAKAGVEDANKYGYIIRNYDKRIDEISVNIETFKS